MNIKICVKLEIRKTMFYEFITEQQNSFMVLLFILEKIFILMTIVQLKKVKQREELQF